MQADLEAPLYCSYQASVPGFVKAGFSTVEAEELMRRSVRLAVETRDEFWAERQQAQAASHKGDYGPPERAMSGLCSPCRHVHMPCCMQQPSERTMYVCIPVTATTVCGTIITSRL